MRARTMEAIGKTIDAAIDAVFVLALLVCIAVCCATEPGTCSDGHRPVTTESRIAD